MKPFLSNFSMMLLSTTSSYLIPAAFGSDFVTSEMTFANPSRVGLRFSIAQRRIFRQRKF